MTRGNFAIAYLETSISRTPKNPRIPGSPYYDMVIMGDNGIGHVYPIPKAEAIKLSKEISAFKRELKAKMMIAAKKFNAGKR
jgi:hypothetical protein